MKREIPRWLITSALVGVVTLVATIPPARLTFAKAVQKPLAAGHSCIVITGSGDSTFTRNFNPFGSANDTNLTHGAIYQPLMILTTAGGGHKYPLLATGFKYSKDAKTLYIFLRHGVKWSDGQPFTSKDVVYTIQTAAHQNKAMDQYGLLASDTSVKNVTAMGPYEVAVHFSKRDVITGQNILSTGYMLPQHIWSKVSDPTKFTNPNPVGTGPFTQVKQVNGQQYTLGKNPHYWMKGKPAVSCVKRVYASGNDAAELMLIRGDVDWTGDFIADAQKAYVSHDPAHYHYFYATNGDPVGLFYDDSVYPWSLVGFRKAISMAIDRNQMYKVGEYGYAPPADALGIQREYPKWADPKVEAAGKSLVTYSPSKAKAALLKLGFKYDGSTLIDPKGNKVSLNLDVIAGWTDWVLSNQILQKNLQAIGITVNLHLSPDYGTWATPVDAGQVVSFHWPCGGGFTPYNIFWNHLSTRAKQLAPPGKEVTGGCDWERYSDPTASKLLKQWSQTPSVSQEKKIASEVERIFLKDYPYIPLFVGPYWYTYSTKYFTGWPTPSHYYAIGSEYTYPDNGLVLSDITPVK